MINDKALRVIRDGNNFVITIAVDWAGTLYSALEALDVDDHGGDPEVIADMQAVREATMQSLRAADPSSIWIS